MKPSTTSCGLGKDLLTVPPRLDSSGSKQAPAAVIIDRTVRAGDVSELSGKLDE